MNGVGLEPTKIKLSALLFYPLKLPYLFHYFIVHIIIKKYDMIFNWGCWSRTNDEGVKDPCLTAWPIPNKRW